MTSSIRALQTPEIRARTLSGRYQISENGQHLVDGIPFGRPYLRQPNRPAIHIPPRKRRRLTYGEEEGVGEGFQKNISPALSPEHWKIPLDDLEDDEEDDPHWDSESSEASDDEESEPESEVGAPEDSRKDLDEEETSHESEASSS